MGGQIARRSPFYQSAAGEGRTPNLLIRSQMLYPIELRLRDGQKTKAENVSPVKPIQKKLHLTRPVVGATLSNQSYQE